MQYTYDINMIKEFVSMLPDLEEKYVYLLMLQSRSRYVKKLLGIKIPDACLMWDKVAWGDGWRDALIRRILRFVTLASQADKLFVLKGKPCPVLATGILLVINPARVDTAFTDFIKGIVEDAVSQRWDRIAKLERFWFGCLHRRSRRNFHTIDVDTKDENVVSEVESALDKYGGWYMKIETPRGFHYVIRLSEVSTKFFTKFLKQEFPELMKKHRDEDGNPLIEYKKDPLEPVPGTMYGGFLVKLHKK